MAEKSRADYFKQRRETQKNLSVLLDKKTLEEFESQLEKRNRTKVDWIREKIENEKARDYILNAKEISETMNDEIKGEALKRNLIAFFDDLVEINRQTKSTMERLRDSYLPAVEVKEWLESHEKSIERNNLLIEVVRSQLEREFGYIC